MAKSFWQRLWEKKFKAGNVKYTTKSILFLLIFFVIWYEAFVLSKNDMLPNYQLFLLTIITSLGAFFIYGFVIHPQAKDWYEKTKK